MIGERTCEADCRLIRGRSERRRVSRRTADEGGQGDGWLRETNKNNIATQRTRYITEYSDKTQRYSHCIK